MTSPARKGWRNTKRTKKIVLRARNGVINYPPLINHKVQFQEGLRGIVCVCGGEQDDDEKSNLGFMKVGVVKEEA
jgi:hypothetical protein